LIWLISYSEKDPNEADLAMAMLAVFLLASVHIALTKKIVIEGHSRDEAEYENTNSIAVLGDSITQYGGQVSGWCNLLGQAVSGTATVTNYGVSGQNSAWGVSQVASMASGLVATVMFGANDAASNAQGVPLETFKSNLATIVSKLKLKFELVLLLANTPVHDAFFGAGFCKNHGEEATRFFSQSKVYAAAACDVAVAQGIPCVDLWHKMVQATPVGNGLAETPGFVCDGGVPQVSTPAEDPNAPWARFLCDGLHLSPVGNRFVADGIMAAIKQNLPSFSLSSTNASTQSIG